MKRAWAILFAIGFPVMAWAHVGSPNVFYEGKAGPYRVRVIIRPPSVVPGLAEINVRVQGEGVQRVTALPVFWQTGRKGAPPPDVAELVHGETNLYASTLWFMSSGAYSIEVGITGGKGQGSVSVPVNSVATTRRELPTWMGAILAALGVFLFIMAVKLAGAAQGESMVEPGAEVPRRARVRSWVAMGISLVLYTGAVAGGRVWWNAVDSDYRNNRLFRPVPVKADVRSENTQRILRLVVEQSADPRREFSPVLPDHGKIMHLFLVREPELNAFAHVHPVQRDRRTFEVALPPLPPGSYRIYADVTQESGFAQTMVATVEIAGTMTEAEARMWEMAAREPVCASPQTLNAGANLFLAHDADDSWHVGGAGALSAAQSASLGGAAKESREQTCRLANGCTMVWENGGALIENHEANLEFKVLSPAGRPLRLEAYMGMFGHAAVRRKDGAVFAHLHPMGTISMASQQSFAKRERSAAVADTDEKSAHPEGTVESVGFPYEFPRDGSYRIWVQVKAEGKVYTGVFDAEVEKGK